LCQGGADIIQLRAKHSSLDELENMALRVRHVTDGAGVGLVINDHLPVARKVRADFCHLGQEDFFDAGNTHTSQLLKQEGVEGNQLRIGLSTHSRDQAKSAENAGAAYVGVGPVFPTATKPGV